MYIWSFCNVLTNLPERSYTWSLALTSALTSLMSVPALLILLFLVRHRSMGGALDFVGHARVNEVADTIGENRD